MIIGYELYGSDNDSQMFDNDDPGWSRCPRCGFNSDFDYLSPMFELGRKNFDIASTCDCRYIVSLKFKEFCLRHGYSGLVLRELPNDPDFFKFDVLNLVTIDKDRTNLEYDSYCDKCGNYHDVVAKRIFLKDIDKPLEDSFYATDMRFAHGNCKHRLMIVGAETYAKLKQAKFKGVLFKKILYPYELTPLTWMIS